VSVALRRYPIWAIDRIRDTCIYLNFVSELGGRFHWLIQWRRSNKYTPGDSPPAFQDKCEGSVGHPPDLGADEMVRVSP
jgi:hypothetical protein